jgi:proteasome lid subunit RPN8/RPN11
MVSLILISIAGILFLVVFGSSILYFVLENAATDLEREIAATVFPQAQQAVVRHFERCANCRVAAKSEGVGKLDDGEWAPLSSLQMSVLCKDAHK